MVIRRLSNIVVLLNNDVRVEKDFLKTLKNHFRNENIFAVTLHEKGEGFSKAHWKDGFFQFNRGEEFKTLHKSSWASGGSAAFRKKYWDSLGGFDPIFHPGYWEDVDLSYRAIKQGYDIFWEPNSKVIHQHGTTFEKIMKKSKKEWIQQRNQLLFIWKNIDDSNLLSQHKKALVKRLFGGMGIGYWIPFIWALLKKGEIEKEINRKKLSDLQVINYVNS